MTSPTDSLVITILLPNTRLSLEEDGSSGTCPLKEQEGLNSCWWSWYISDRSLNKSPQSHLESEKNKFCNKNAIIVEFM